MAPTCQHWTDLLGDSQDEWVWFLKLHNGMVCHWHGRIGHIGVYDDWPDGRIGWEERSAGVDKKRDFVIFVMDYGAVFPAGVRLGIHSDYIYMMI